MATTDELNELRRVMGTLPDKNTETKTDFIVGTNNLRVELVDKPVNPYKAMYIMATSCWGNKVDKWQDTSPENRFRVVKESCINKNGLPLPLEAPKFTFVIEGLSRAAFDQIARARIGTCFSAKGMRDNNWSSCNFIIPTALREAMDKDPELEKMYYDWADQTKKLYSSIAGKHKGSWQTARSVLPLYVEYGFSMTINYAALLNFCGRRMKFCEMEDTCGTAWLMRQEMMNHFPLLASALKPTCDKAHKCQYHDTYKLSELFGCLFKECGRNPCSATNTYAEFNEACTDKTRLEEQLGIKIPNPDEYPVFESYSDLMPIDKKLFEKKKKKKKKKKRED